MFKESLSLLELLLDRPLRVGVFLFKGSGEEFSLHSKDDWGFSGFDDICFGFDGERWGALCLFGICTSEPVPKKSSSISELLSVCEMYGLDYKWNYKWKFNFQNMMSDKWCNE